MKITNVEKCFCGEMPVILLHNCINCVEYCLECPNCKRGGIFYPTCFTTYKALKRWNAMQLQLKTYNNINKGVKNYDII